jgi:hypothetical protein
MSEGLSKEQQRDTGSEVWEEIARGMAGYVRVEEVKEEPAKRYDVWDGAGDEEVAEAQLKSDIESAESIPEDLEEE